MQAPDETVKVDEPVDPEEETRKALAILTRISQDMKAHPHAPRGGFEDLCPKCGTKLVVVWVRRRKGNSRGRSRQKQHFGAQCQTPGCMSFRGH